MTLHSKYFSVLRQVGKTSERVMSDQLGGGTASFLQHKWILPDGYLTSIWVPISGFDGEEEVDVEIDTLAGTYSFTGPGRHRRLLARPLSDIATYALNLNAWLQEIATIFEIERSKFAPKRQLIEGHLWHLGDLRLGKTSHFAPLYVGLRLANCKSDWSKSLLDRARPARGIVLMDEFDADTVVPNGHHVCAVNSVVTQDGAGVALNREVLDRVLGVVSDSTYENGNSYNETTGVLKLAHIQNAKKFIGIQKSVITMFWLARYGPSLKWSDVVARTGCGKDPGSVFGKTQWMEFLERVGNGLYQIRVRQQKE